MARFSGLVLLSVSISFLPLAAGCGAPSSGEETGTIRFDPCQPLALVIEGSATAAEEDGVRAAADLWNVAAGSRLSVALDASPSVPIRFEPADEASHGLYDLSSGRVRINTDLVAHPLTVTIAHEIGHAMGLLHVIGRPSVMNAGNLGFEPNEGDVAALQTVWGRCDGAPVE